MSSATCTPFLRHKLTDTLRCSRKEHGDAIIIGASSFDQLKETLAAVSAGPLSSTAVKKIDEVWQTIEHEAPLDNYHR